MKSSKQVENVKKQIKSELERFVGVLRKTGIDISAISDKIKGVEHYVPEINKKTYPNYWGYEFDFEMAVARKKIEVQDSKFVKTFVSGNTIRHLHPTNLEKASITINTRVIGDCKNWEKSLSRPETAMQNPFIIANFSVTVSGILDKKLYQTGFHLDLCKIEELNSGEIHPSYHVQFSPSGKHGDDFNTGQVLTCDVPRLIHPPLDFILGFDYMISNFMPSLHNQLLEDGAYTNLLTKYQNIIWRPYFKQIYAHWDKALVTDDGPLWKSDQILPHLV